jgi:hypothetical protein
VKSSIGRFDMDRHLAVYMPTRDRAMGGVVDEHFLTISVEQAGSVSSGEVLNTKNLVW